MADFKKIAADVLEAVGGQENINNVTHCMTRLRFDLKDDTLAKDDVVKSIDGVLGIARSGGQTQVIIGPSVSSVFKELNTILEDKVSTVKADSESVDKSDKKRLTLKQIGSNIMNYLSGSMTPLIPIFTAGAMFKVILSVLGPDMLGLITLDSNLAIVLDFVFDAAFFYLPIYLGYTAAKKLGCSIVLGLMMGGVLLAPDFMALVNSETPFTVYGIPCMVNNYSQSVVPILLSVWVLSYVEKFFKKFIPDVISSIFVPTLTMIVMVPVSLCALAPAGNAIGMALSNAILTFGNVGGFFGIAVIAAVWEYLILTGMHMAIASPCIAILVTQGYENVLFPAWTCATFAVYGMALGSFIRIHQKNEKSMCLSHFISGFVGGVTEPALYGIGLKYKKPLIAMSIGAAAGGAYAGVMNVVCYMIGQASVLGVLCYIGENSMNLVHGVISCVISLAVSAVITYMFGFRNVDVN